MDRRTFLSASALAATSPLFGARAFAQPGPKPASAPGRMERLAAAMAGNRMAIDFDGRAFSGAGSTPY